MASRKLLKEIDIVFKKVDEGVGVFEQIWDKVYSAATAAQKEKYEGDLKKEIKKLQRLRDQIKSWQGDSSIKDKTKLDTYRKLIESKMEKFKVCEKETKTKAFSKEGLALDRTDPKEKAKQDVSDWISDSISRLTDQRDELEAEIEAVLATGKKGKKAGAAAEKVAALQASIEKHTYHSDMLEKVLRAVFNETITTDQANDLKDGIDYYIESNQEADFMEDDTMYDDLDLDSIPAAATLGKREDGEEGEEGLIEGAEKPPVAPPVEETPGAAATSAVVKIGSGGNGVVKRVAAKPVVLPEKTEIATKDVKVGSFLGAVSSGVVNAKPQVKPNIAVPGSSVPAVPAVTVPQNAAAPVKPGISAVIPAKLTETPSSAPPPLAFSSIVKGTSNTAAQVTPAQTPATVQGALQSIPPELTSRSPLVAAPLPAPNSESLAKAAISSPQPRVQSVANNEELQQTVVPKPSVHPFGATKNATAGLNSATAFADPMLNLGGKEDAESEKLREMAHTLSALDAAFSVGLPVSLEAELAAKKRRANNKRGGLGYVSTPSCFPQKPAPVFAQREVFERFVHDSLFFIFYYQQGTYQQYLAARELKSQSWRFHKKYYTWFQRHEEPRFATDEFEKGTYKYFDYILKEGRDIGWTQRFKSDFTFEYAFLEDELV